MKRIFLTLFAALFAVGLSARELNLKAFVHKELDFIPRIAGMEDESIADEKTWEVGDYYNENGKEGVVFWVDESRKHGKILSLTRSDSLLWASTEMELTDSLDTNSGKKEVKTTLYNHDGAANMKLVKKIDDWQSIFPAFKWCYDLGEEWYLPADEELYLIFKSKKKIDRALKKHGGAILSHDYYWSSTTSSTMICIRRNSKDYKIVVPCAEMMKLRVRAVAAF